MVFEWYVHRTGEGVFPEISGSSPPFREIAPPQTILSMGLSKAHLLLPQSRNLCD